MKAFCPHCFIKLGIREEKLPRNLSSLKCPNCGFAIPVSVLLAKEGQDAADYETVVLQRDDKKKGCFIVSESEETPQQTIPLPEGKYTIGRKSSTLTETAIGIVTSDRLMSRAHIAVEVVKDAHGEYKFYLSDNKSKNNTLYNSSYLQDGEVVTLQDGDEIILGRTVLRFHE